MQEKLTFLIVGGMSAATHFLVLHLTFVSLHWPLAYATLLGYFFSLGISYTLNYLITFKSNQTVLLSSTKYVITTLLGLAWNLSLMVLLVSFFDVHYVVAFVFMSIVVAINNYLFSKHWVF